MHTIIIIFLGIILSLFFSIKARTVWARLFTIIYIVFFLSLGLLEFELVDASICFYFSFSISFLLFLISYKKALGNQLLNILFTGILFLTFVWRFLELAYFGYLILCQACLITILIYSILKNIIRRKSNIYYNQFAILTSLIFLMDIINFLILK